MGALFSSFLETLVWGEHYWIEQGLRQGYFSLGKHWDTADVAHAKQILLMHDKASTILHLSLVGQTFSNMDDLSDLLQVIVARPELQVLRLTCCSDGAMVRIAEAVIGQYRPTHLNKLHLEISLDATNVAEYWNELTLLPSYNKLVTSDNEKL